MKAREHSVQHRVVQPSYRGAHARRRRQPRSVPIVLASIALVIIATAATRDTWRGKHGRLGEGVKYCGWDDRK